MSTVRADKLSFHFKLPSDGLALSAVLLQLNAVVLVFRAAYKVPSLTEQLVAAIMRLVYIDCTRPAFFYRAFPPGHPYEGRLYKSYHPQWLRGTQLGDLLAEVDWQMKCLHIGARSNEAKDAFEAWNHSSRLTGLASRLCFPDDEHPAGFSVMMSCKSLNVRESADLLSFVGEPQMTIRDQTNSAYSDYITRHFDSVAYHDEPLFLQMKEVIKLIVAAEWMKERGVKMNKAWMMDCTRGRRRTIPRPIAVKPDWESLAKTLQSTPLSLPSPLMPTTVAVQKTGTRHTTICCTRNQVTMTISSDHDAVFGPLLDHRSPVSFDVEKGCWVIPDVDSWNELFSETVPWPHTWVGGNEYCSFTGGVTTREFPVTKEPSVSKSRPPVQSAAQSAGQYTSCADKLYIKSSTSQNSATEKVPAMMVPRQQVVLSPPTDVSVKSNKQALLQASGSQHYGYEDSSGARLTCSETGSVIDQQSSVPCVASGDRLHVAGFLSCLNDQTGSQSRPPVSSATHTGQSTRPVKSSTSQNKATQKIPGMMVPRQHAPPTDVSKEQELSQASGPQQCGSAQEISFLQSPGGEGPTLSEDASDEESICTNASERMCAVCQEALSVGNTTITECKHEFHENCISEWLKDHSTCPMCRKAFGQNNQKPDGPK